jgi:hypothetical protein
MSWVNYCNTLSQTMFKLKHVFSSFLFVKSEVSHVGLVAAPTYMND